MFRGVSALNLDSKGRLAIPTRYREALQRQSEGRLVVTVNNATRDERCLWLYPLPQWEEIERRLVALPSTGDAFQRIKRILIGHATDAELDGSGRVLLSQPLREFAGLDKRVVLIGQGNKFEVWNEDTWNTLREAWLTEQVNEGPMHLDLEQLSL
jgi:MraZ protein